MPQMTIITAGKAGLAGALIRHAAPLVWAWMAEQPEARAAVPTYLNSETLINNIYTNIPGPAAPGGWQSPPATCRQAPHVNAAKNSVGAAEESARQSHPQLDDALQAQGWRNEDRGLGFAH